MKRVSPLSCCLYGRRRRTRPAPSPRSPAGSCSTTCCGTTSGTCRTREPGPTYRTSPSTSWVPGAGGWLGPGSGWWSWTTGWTTHTRTYRGTMIRTSAMISTMMIQTQCRRLELNNYYLFLNLLWVHILYLIYTKEDILERIHCT